MKIGYDSLNVATKVQEHQNFFDFEISWQKLSFFIR